MHLPNRRILLIDDSTAIHEDFKKILCSSSETASNLDDARAAFFGGNAVQPTVARFEIDSAYQGREGLEKVKAAVEEGRPYAMTFVDVRMPPGWDGIETISEIYKVDDRIQTVICTAFSDYSWEQMIEQLGQSDRLLILRKPFDPMEICQLAAALTEKWTVAEQARELVEDLRRAEQEARVYASSLETVNRALETSKAAADKSSELKSEFLVHLSNEVNKDLTDILDRADPLRGESTPRQLEFLETVIGSSHRLMTCFDQVLDITMMEAGRLTVDPVMSSVVDIVEGVVSDHRAPAEEKGITLLSEFQGSVPESILTDPERVGQILANLVENAIRYTEKGSVRVRVSMEQTGDWKHPLLRFDVVDTGVGIPYEFHRLLFEPFFQLREGDVGHGGTGLGLALSKRLARLMRAELRMESTPGEGSCFSLVLETGNLSGVKML